MTHVSASLVLESLETNQSLNCLVMANAPGPNRNVIKSQAFQTCELALAHNKTLTMLDLHDNLVGNEAIACISSGVAHNSTLTSLNISHTLLDCGCISSLLQLLQFSRIRYLDISRNHLTNIVGCSCLSSNSFCGV